MHANAFRATPPRFVVVTLGTELPGVLYVTPEGIRSNADNGVMATSLRTDACGQLSVADVGRVVRLGGWVHRSRDLGGLVFIDLRDRTGLVQLAFGPAWSSPEASTIAAAVGVESVVLCEG